MFYSPAIHAAALALLLADAALHLLWPKCDTPTKALLLPLVTLFYVSGTPTPLPLLIAAFLASWLGDVLLELPGDGWFTAGGVAFLTAHILFMLTYAGQVQPSGLRWGVLLPVLAVYLGVSLWIMRLIWAGTAVWLRLPMLLYLLANSAMNLFALARLLARPDAGGIVAYLGALLFFVSDCTLFVERNGGKRPFGRFPAVMSTYISAQLFIALGMLL